MRRTTALILNEADDVLLDLVMRLSGGSVAPGVVRGQILRIRREYVAQQTKARAVDKTDGETDAADHG